ncbi:putative replicase [Gregarina niphandrodes]|uniref:Replicase n=1 Tax=Gregarina niphandrodes TaxID=110365 RepID=A0A023B9A0_GRENI|nr:putative replicase [Gregarina niphandrodes]EZG72284.1 putative replicase [Gregarina niphandrodes]|eukprot:XP_011129784.1 putative replicase [Gregarina niphandrodes]
MTLRHQLHIVPRKKHVSVRPWKTDKNRNAHDRWQQLSIATLWEEEPEWMLKHHSAVSAYHKQFKKVTFVRPKPQVIVLWGPPGTGKSHTARSICDNYYVKPTGNWWDGYFGQDLVIFDDFYGTEKYCDMLRWLSENPIKVKTFGWLTTCGRRPVRGDGPTCGCRHPTGGCRCAS